MHWLPGFGSATDDSALRAAAETLAPEAWPAVRQRAQLSHTKPPVRGMSQGSRRPCPR